MDLSRILNDYNTDTPASSMPTTATLSQRTGKWSDEEEQYACALVRYFVAGSLVIPTGTSLRSFLAKKLRCSAMRVSTKLSMDMLGDLKIPKKLGQKRFFPMGGLTEVHKQRVANELRYLEAAYLHKENLPVECEATTVEATPPSNVSTGSDDVTDGPQRVGSWSEEEQSFACALIDAFLRGVVNAVEGTTLRVFLADRLCCNPMRISKKLATGKMGGRVIPKRLGSTIYRSGVGLEPGAVSRTEYHLAQARFNCFSTGPQPRHLHSPVQARVRIPTQSESTPCYQLVHTPPALSQLRVYSSLPKSSRQYQKQRTDLYPLCSPIYTAMSPLRTGMKRKLPLLELPSKPYLPGLVREAPVKKTRFTTKVRGSDETD